VGRHNRDTVRELSSETRSPRCVLCVQHHRVHTDRVDGLPQRFGQHTLPGFSILGRPAPEGGRLLQLQIDNLYIRLLDPAKGISKLAVEHPEAPDMMVIAAAYRHCPEHRAKVHDRPNVKPTSGISSARGNPHARKVGACALLDTPWLYTRNA